jgi:hypothetical protein
LQQARSRCRRSASKIDVLEEGLGEWIDRIGQNCHATQRWRHIAKQLDVLCGRLGAHIGEAGDVPAGRRQTLHESGANWIGDPRHDDRYGRCRARFAACTQGE